MPYPKTREGIDARTVSIPIDPGVGVPEDYLMLHFIVSAAPFKAAINLSSLPILRYAQLA